MDAKIGTDSDVKHTKKRIEDEQNGCKPNKKRADKISQKEGKAILDRNQKIGILLKCISLRYFVKRIKFQFQYKTNNNDIRPYGKETFHS